MFQATNKVGLQTNNILGYKQSRATKKISLWAMNTICFRLQTKKGYKQQKFPATNANCGLQTQTHGLQTVFSEKYLMSFSTSIFLQEFISHF
jgi:hypothetical protein